MGYTLFVLTWLSAVSVGTFTRDTATVTSRFTTETDRLLRENRAHWSEQSDTLRSAADALQEAVKLQGATLDTIRQVMQFNQELLVLERERDRLRAEAAEVRRQRIQPLLGFVLRVPSGGLQVKHVVVVVFNRGAQAQDLTVFFGIPPNQMYEDHLATLGYHTNHQFDFGDISGWPEVAEFEVTVEASDQDRNKYRFPGSVRYARNKALVVSYPTVEPEDWQFPPPLNVN